MLPILRNKRFFPILLFRSQSMIMIESAKELLGSKYLYLI